MPQVPYSPVPGVTPSTQQPSDYISTQASPNDFGAQVGQAVQGLGGAVEKAGSVASEIATQQQVRTNNIAVNDGFYSLLKQHNNALGGDPNVPGDTGYFGLHGQAAVDARPALLQSLDAGRQSIRDGLGNQAQQIAFDEQSRRLEMNTAERINSKFEQEFNNAAVLSNQAGAAERVRSVGLDPFNMQNLQHQLADDDRNQRAQIAMKGADPNTPEGHQIYQNAVAEGRQALFRQTAIGQGNLNPTAAITFLQQNQGEFDPGTWRGLMDAFRGKANEAADAAAANGSDQAVGQRNNPTLFNAAVEAGKKNLADTAQMNQWTPDTLALKQRQYTDQTYSRAIGAIATNDPMGAWSWYQDHKDQISNDGQAVIERQLKQPIMANQARIQAGNIVGGTSNVAAGAVAGEAAAQGQDPKRALTWASLESGVGTVPDKPGNPHTGLFQMGPDEWKANGGDPSQRGQVAAEARVGVKSMSASMAAADAAVGGKAQDWQGYLVHQQGAAGGPALLKADPATPVIDALAPAYKGDRVAAAQAITANGGDAGGSVGDFLGVVQSRYAKAASSVTLPSGQPQSADIRDNAASMLAQARNTPDPFGGDDPQWHDMLESHVRTRIGEIEYEQAQAERGAQQTLLTAAIGAPGGAGGTGTKPTDLATLMQDPKFATAWGSAKPETQHGILQILEHNAQRVEPPLTQEAMQRYYGLLGERGNNPDAFLKENLADPDLVKLLPSHLLLGLMAEQKSAELKNAMETDKGVKLQAALSVVKPDLLAAGIRIPTKPGEQAQVYDQFVGRFQDALDVWKTANKKQPTDSDVRSVGQSLLTQGYQTGGGWFGNDTSTRLFQSPDGGKGFYAVPPAADRTAIVRDWQTVHPGQTPTETQIRQVYKQSKLRTSKPAPAAPAAIAAQIPGQ